MQSLGRKRVQDGAIACAQVSAAAQALLQLSAEGCGEAQTPANRSGTVTNDVLYQLSYCGGPMRREYLRMIFSENRYPLFRIMRQPQRVSRT